MKRTKTYLLGILGAGLLAIPLAMPSTAQADDLKISLNLGGGAPVYYQPAPQRVVYKEVYRPAPQRVVYKEVYRPAPRIVYRDVHRGRGHNKHEQAWGHGRWDKHDRYVAWR